MNLTGHFECRSPRLHGRQGFALLVTITLLSLLVLLLVSLSTLTRVEAQVSSNSQKTVQARRNAMMALNLAIGQLQTHAGPDQAVTARADITADPSLKQAYLTGVWKTTNTTSTPDAWLVSGNESSPIAKNPANVPDPVSGTEPVVDGAPGSVFLVGAHSVDAPAKRVRLDKQAIAAPAGLIPGLGPAAAPTVGHYAYWVGDEGIKASASLINPLLGIDAIKYDNSTGSTGQGDDWNDAVKRERLDQMQLPRPRLEHVFTGLSPDTDGLTVLPNIKNISQLLLMPNSPTAVDLRKNFHTITPLSKAVLVDVPNGRLKKDLSDIGAAPPDPAIRLYQQTRPDSTSGFTAIYHPVKATGPTTSYKLGYSIGPVLTEFGVRFRFYRAPDSRIYYQYVIDVELWNPYAAKLKLAAEALEIEVTDGLPVFNLGGNNCTIPAGLIKARVDPSTEWNPGEVKVLRGVTLLSPIGGPVTYTDTDSGVTAATEINVTSPTPANSLRIVMTIAGNALATYIPNNPFQNVSKLSGGAGFQFGYGYGFISRPDLGLENVTNGFLATSFDPRAPVLSGDFRQTVSSTWTTNPTLNVGGIPLVGSDIFTTTATIVLFDLPRQEITSLGMLTHLIGADPATASNSFGAKPYLVGNRWGGALNEIFDQYYVSTVPRFATAWTAENGLPLPNRYLSVYHPDGTAAIALPDLRSVDKSARYLMQDGAFNINSTSVEAWKAVLGSKLSAWKYLADTTTGIPLDNVFFRLPHGAQQLTNPPLDPAGTGTSELTDANAQDTSGRRLTASQVDAAAQAIVNLIKARKRPFSSLKDFINDGVIINSIYFLNQPPTTPALTATFQHVPGAVIQSDVIGAIAPVMSVRSDTFLVRAYGDSQNPVTGMIEGRAWCEAVVQRVPDLANHLAAPIADVITPNPAAYPFGRKFKTISFRWLTPSDI